MATASDRLTNALALLQQYARIVASMVADPAQLTSRQMDAWVKGFAAWDVCDQTCLNAFCKSPLSWRKVEVWVTRKDEFVCRPSAGGGGCM